MVNKINEIEMKQQDENIDKNDIAIIGISACLPKAANAKQYWENIINNLECSGVLPDSRKSYIDSYLAFRGKDQDKIKYNRMSYIDDIDLFDPKIFHLSPKEAKLMDLRQRLFLLHAWQAIEDAGYSTDELKGNKVGVYAGITELEDTKYYDIIRSIDKNLESVSGSSNMQAIIPSRISYLLNLKGPSMLIDTACSSSLVALHEACRGIKNADCEMAIVGSVRLHLIPTDDEVKVGFESEDGITRPFDDGANGAGLGEGVICILLKSAVKAIEEKDIIYALIKGTAINQDGNSLGITAPNADAQSVVIQEAWKAARITPEEISYIETHGTGTPLGDPVEIEGLTKAFSSYTSKKQFCAVGSVKSNIGHLFDASGLASLVKCVFALNEKVLPASINYKKPSRYINLIDSPLYVNARNKKWEVGNRKRICGISSFGFGGTNCHIVLQEAPRTHQRNFQTEAEENYVLLLSAQNEKVLRELVELYLKEFNQYADVNPKDLCFTAAVGRTHYQYRLAVIFRNYSELKKLLSEIYKKNFLGLSGNHIKYGCVPKLGIDNDYQIIGADEFVKYSTAEKNQYIADYYINVRETKLKGLFPNTCHRTRLPYNTFEKKSYLIEIPQMSSSAKASNTDTDKIFLEGRGDKDYSETEIKLGNIVKLVLDFTKINIHDNFYELGGDSVLAMQIYDKICNTFGVSISVADIYSYPTIAQLGAYIDSLKINEEICKDLGNTKINQENEKDIAIIGMAGRFPKADKLEEFWINLCNKKNCITNIPSERKQEIQNYLELVGLKEKNVEFEKAGYLSDISGFDHAFFGIPEKEAILMDPAQRLLLQEVYGAFEDAGYGGTRMKGSNTGVYIGYLQEHLYNYYRYICESDPSLAKDAVSGNLTSILAGRISYTFDLRGPSMTIDSACSSSLVALNIAVNSLRAGECSKAVVGGIKIKLLPIYNPDSNIGVESENFMIRAFDDSADGIVEGEAVCAVLLKPLNQAIKDGDNIHAVIKGIAVNQDGTGMGIMAPRAETQKDVIVKAWDEAGINPDSITYIESHGTGTKLGDLIEYEAIRKAFELYTDKKQFCAIGTVKSNIGHLYQVSGITGIMKAVLCLENGMLTSSVNFDRPNRLMDFEDSPIYVNDRIREWKGTGSLRRCGITSLGLSGTNCHVLLEEFEMFDRHINSEKYKIVTLSAQNIASLQCLVTRYYKFLQTIKNIDMNKLSYTANIGRGHHKYRLALIVKNQSELEHKLKGLNVQKLSDGCPKDIFYGEGKENGTNSVGFFDFPSNLDNLTKENLIQISKGYISGADVEWEKLYHINGQKIISLPTYPFLKKQCWFIPGKEVNKSSSEIGSVANIDLKRDQMSCKKDKLPGSVEQILIEAFTRVLKVDDIHEDDNFFELGGNSFRATELATEIYTLFHVPVPLSDILSYPTIRDLAEHIHAIIIRSDDTEKHQGIDILPEKDLYDLSIKQMDLWLASKVYNEDSALNITWAADLYNFELPILQKAFEGLLIHFPILRTKIVIRKDIPKQKIVPVDKTVEILDNRDISGEKEIEKCLKEIIETEVGRQFALENNPLVRITFIKISEKRIALVFVISHLIADWWSLDVLVQELKKYYKALVQKEKVSFEPLKLKYSDFAVWHKNKVVEQADQYERYWNEILRGPLPVLNIKTDFDRPLIKGQTGKSLDFILNAEIMAKLKQVADLNQGTMFMSVLSAVYTLLYKYSGQLDIIMGINTSGREHPQLVDQIGYFINVLPLRIMAERTDNYNSLFAKMRKVVLGALENQDYPFNLMLQNKSVIRDPGRSPIFDVMVQYLKDPQIDGFVINDAEIREIKYDSLESKYDLVFNFIENGEHKIRLQLEYSDSLFKEMTILRMVKRLEKIFQIFSENQQLPIDDLSTENDSLRKNLKIIRGRKE